MKILVPAVLILAIILTFIVVDACRITPRIYHTGDTALVLTVYNVPVLVYVVNDPAAFVSGRQQRRSASSRRTTGRWLQTQ